MIKLRLGSIKHLTQGHLATEGWDSNPGISGSKDCALDYHIIMLGLHSFSFNFKALGKSKQEGYFLGQVSSFKMNYILFILLHTKINFKDFT